MIIAGVGHGPPICSLLQGFSALNSVPRASPPPPRIQGQGEKWGDPTSAGPHQLPVVFQLKEKSNACGGNLGSIEELRGAIYLAEEACPGISDTMVATLVQRLQR